MRFKTITITAIVLSICLWFLTGRVLASDTDDGWRILRDTTTSALKFFWYPKLPAGMSSTPAITIVPGGNVGIGGTATPQWKLDVDATTGSGIRLGSSTGAFIASRINDGGGAYRDLTLQVNNFDLRTATSNGGTSSSSRLFIENSSGNVGINTTGVDYKLEVFGSAGKPGGGNWSESSDSRLKTNITTYSDALSRLLQLRGVKFNWINPEEHDSLAETQGGFIAQEVEKIFPQWVDNINPSGADAKLVGTGEKIKSLTLPTEFNALIVESIKEQQNQIDQQAKEIEALKQAIQNLKKQTSR